MQENLTVDYPASGYFDFTNSGVLTVSGKDSRDFLNRMSTINFKKSVPGEATIGAFLTGKAHTISIVTIIDKEDSFEIIVPRAQTVKTLEHLEKFHFGEVLEIKDVSDKYSVLAFYKPHPKCLSQLNLDAAIWKDAQISDLYWAKFESAKPKQYPEMHQMEMKAFEYLRVLYGVPELGKDLDDSDIFLEGNYEVAVARNKGCYPGQEVVERIFTYGQVNKKVLKVNVTLGAENELGTLPQVIRAKDKVVGNLTSLIKEPSDSTKAIGLAMVQKEFWESTEVFTTDKNNLVTINRDSAS